MNSYSSDKKPLCDEKNLFTLQSSVSSLYNEISSQLKTLVKASALDTEKLNDTQTNGIGKENKDYNNLKKKIKAIHNTCNFADTSGQSTRAEIKLAKVHELEDELENMQTYFGFQIEENTFYCFICMCRLQYFYMCNNYYLIHYIIALITQYYLCTLQLLEE